jgi:hypothetical protein
LNGDGITTPEEVSRKLTDQSDGLLGILNHLVMHQTEYEWRVERSDYAVGAEYFQDSFAMQMGYFHESPQKEHDNFFLSAGFKYTTNKVDVSYLFSASKNH